MSLTKKKRISFFFLEIPIFGIYPATLTSKGVSCSIQTWTIQISVELTSRSLMTWCAHLILNSLNLKEFYSVLLFSNQARGTCTAQDLSSGIWMWIQDFANLKFQKDGPVLKPILTNSSLPCLGIIPCVWATLSMSDVKKTRSCSGSLFMVIDPLLENLGFK